MTDTVQPIPLRIQRMPRHWWRGLRRQALKTASSLGMSRRAWDAAREATLSRRHADMMLVLTRRVPEAGAFAALIALVREYEATLA